MLLISVAELRQATENDRKSMPTLVHATGDYNNDDGEGENEDGDEDEDDLVVIIVLTTTESEKIRR